MSSVQRNWALGLDLIHKQWDPPGSKNSGMCNFAS